MEIAEEGHNPQVLETIIYKFDKAVKKKKAKMFIEVYILNYSTTEYKLYILITSVSYDQEQLSIFRKELRESREPDG